MRHIGCTVAGYNNAMSELSVQTRRVRRNWIERLRGFDKAYETVVTDGSREARGRGETKQQSLESAKQSWLQQSHP